MPKCAPTYEIYTWSSRKKQYMKGVQKRKKVLFEMNDIKLDTSGENIVIIVQRTEPNVNKNVYFRLSRDCLMSKPILQRR